MKFRTFFAILALSLFVASNTAAQTKVGPPTGSVGPGVVLSNGGYAPAVQFNAVENVTLEGTFNMYSGVTAFGAEMYYHFGREGSSSPATLIFEPAIGAGIYKVSVDPDIGMDANLTGFSASGGVFAHLRENPHFRFKGVLSLVEFDYEGVSFRGFHAILGAYYFF